MRRQRLWSYSRQVQRSMWRDAMASLAFRSAGPDRRARRDKHPDGGAEVTGNGEEAVLRLFLPRRRGRAADSLSARAASESSLAGRRVVGSGNFGNKYTRTTDENP